MIPFIWHFGKGKNIEIKTDERLQRVGEEDHWLSEAQGLFKGGEIFCMVM